MHLEDTSKRLQSNSRLINVFKTLYLYTLGLTLTFWKKAIIMNLKETTGHMQSVSKMLSDTSKISSVLLTYINLNLVKDFEVDLIFVKSNYYASFRHY